MASRKPSCQTAFSFTTSFCSSFRLIFTFAFRKTLIESKYKHILPPHRRASRRARITRLTDFDWHSHSRSQSVFPVHQRTDYLKMLVCGQAVILVPSPTPLPSNFFTSFWISSTWRQKSNSPHGIFRLLTRPPATQARIQTTLHNDSTTPHGHVCLVAAPYFV